MVERFFDVGYVVVSDRAGHWQAATSASVEFPAALVEKTKPHFEKTTVGDVLAEQINVSAFARLLA